MGLEPTTSCMQSVSNEYVRVSWCHLRLADLDFHHPRTAVICHVLLTKLLTWEAPRLGNAAVGGKRSVLARASRLGRYQPGCAWWCRNDPGLADLHTSVEVLGSAKIVHDAGHTKVAAAPVVSAASVAQLATWWVIRPTCSPSQAKSPRSQLTTPSACFDDSSMEYPNPFPSLWHRGRQWCGLVPHRSNPTMAAGQEATSQTGHVSSKPVPAAERYSRATMQLVEELRLRGLTAGCRAVEHWAELGLAPPPVRHSQGRLGFTSEYPLGAIDQYVAVASVMRRGLDWRVAGLVLISQGHLPSREKTFRQLLQFLFELDGAMGEDALDFSEEQVARATGDVLFEQIARVIERNIGLAKIVDPVSGEEVSAETAGQSAMARTLAAMLGEALPHDAAVEVAAAAGLIEADLSEELCEHRVKYVERLFEDVLSLEELSVAAQKLDPSCLQAAVLEVRSAIADFPAQEVSILPRPWRDVLVVVLALAFTMIEDLGGSSWFEGVSPGLIDADARASAAVAEGFSNTLKT